MSRRERDESRQILLQNFGNQLKTEDILSVFCKFGKIDLIKFTGRRQCIIQFEQLDSASKALSLHNSKQPTLFTSFLSVTSLDTSSKPNKKSHVPSGSYIVLDPPRFNNFYIPVLPSFLTDN